MVSSGLYFLPVFDENSGQQTAVVYLIFRIFKMDAILVNRPFNRLK
jgi:hypothetical protein